MAVVNPQPTLETNTITQLVGISTISNSGASFWRPILAFGDLLSPNLGATQGVVAWVALSRAFPKHKELVFCLVLLNYMTSGLFS